MNEGCEVQTERKDLGETLGALERRAARESLATRVRPDRWAPVDPQDLRGSLVMQGFPVTRDPRERTESLASEETKERWALLVFGASRANGVSREPVAWTERRERRENPGPRAALGWRDARETRGSRACRARRGPRARRA